MYTLNIDPTSVHHDQEYSFLGTLFAGPAKQEEDQSVWWAEVEKVRSSPLKVLTQEQREFYFQNGYLKVENAISEEWLQRLRTVTES